MPTFKTLLIKTHGEGFIDITKEVTITLQEHSNFTGVAHLFCQHTSCALVVNENYDPSARVDLENFLKRLAPRNDPSSTHTIEGEDDSPSHMKSALLNHHLALPVENGKWLKGTWQGIFLAEFRDAPHQRTVLVGPF